MSHDAFEQGRLAALRGTGLLDSAAELRFDRFTRVASALLRAPIALISLIDEDRQWFKSCIGLDASETPREHAFCAHAIRAAGIMVVPDATLDPRFAANPLVTGPPNIRFYAGAPLILSNGQALGTLCVIDDKPRDGLTETDSAALSDLAQMVVAEIEGAETARARELALAEMKHRMGNMFGQVGGLISLSNSGDLSKQAYISELHRRLLSLHEINRRLADGDWSNGDLRAVVITALRPVIGDDAERFVEPSPAIDINARAAMTLSMAVSELATNFVKHGGARTGAANSFTLSWRVEDEQFTLSWRETTPSAVSAARVGFGSVLLQRIAPAELGGAATHAFSASGVAYDLRAPLATLR